MFGKREVKGGRMWWEDVVGRRGRREGCNQPSVRWSLVFALAKALVSFVVQDDEFMWGSLVRAARARPNRTEILPSHWRAASSALDSTTLLF